MIEKSQIAALSRHLGAVLSGWFSVVLSGILWFSIFLTSVFRLLHVRNCNCKYADAELSYNAAVSLADRLESHGHSVNKAVLYTERCSLLYSKSQYDEVRNSFFHFMYICQ